jgi:hypothetical protein
MNVNPGNPQRPPPVPGNPEITWADKPSKDHRYDVKNKKGLPTWKKERAAISTPAFLEVKDSHDAQGRERGKGVFTKTFIPKDTRFGPVQGDPFDKAVWEEKKRKAHATGGKVWEKFLHRQDYTWQNLRSTNTKRRVMQCHNPNTSNYLRFVNDLKGKQNMKVVDSQKGLFYRTTKNIQPNTELSVSYGAAYWRGRNNQRV